MGLRVSEALGRFSASSTCRTIRVGACKGLTLGVLLASATPASAMSDWLRERTDSRADVRIAGVVQIEAAVADDESERTYGLMHAPTLGENEGMLFAFPKAQPVAFWMKNTPEPLDIIFVSPERKIISIARMTTPYSTAPIPSGGAAAAALEIAGGRAAGLGLAVGDSLDWRIIPD